MGNSNNFHNDPYLRHNKTVQEGLRKKSSEKAVSTSPLRTSSPTKKGAVIAEEKPEVINNQVNASTKVEENDAFEYQDLFESEKQETNNVKQDKATKSSNANDNSEDNTYVPTIEEFETVANQGTQNTNNQNNNPGMFENAEFGYNQQFESENKVSNEIKPYNEAGYQDDFNNNYQNTSYDNYNNYNEPNYQNYGAYDSNVNNQNMQQYPPLNSSEGIQQTKSNTGAILNNNDPERFTGNLPDMNTNMIKSKSVFNDMFNNMIENEDNDFNKFYGNDENDSLIKKANDIDNDINNEDDKLTKLEDGYKSATNETENNDTKTLEKKEKNKKKTAVYWIIIITLLVGIFTAGYFIKPVKEQYVKIYDKVTGIFNKDDDDSKNNGDSDDNTDTLEDNTDTSEDNDQNNSNGNLNTNTNPDSTVLSSYEQVLYDEVNAYKSSLFYSFEPSLDNSNDSFFTPALPSDYQQLNNDTLANTYMNNELTKFTKRDLVDLTILGFVTGYDDLLSNGNIGTLEKYSTTAKENSIINTIHENFENSMYPEKEISTHQIVMGQAYGGFNDNQDESYYVYTEEIIVYKDSTQKKIICRYELVNNAEGMNIVNFQSATVN